MVTGDYGNGDKHLDRDKKGKEAGEEAQQQGDASDELSECCDIAEPIRQSERADVVCKAIERCEGLAAAECSGWDHLRISVNHHCNTEDEPQNQDSPRLKTIEPSRHESFS